MKITNANVNKSDIKDNLTSEIKAPNESNNTLNKIEQSIYEGAKKITSKRKPQSFAKEINFEHLEKIKNIGIMRKII